MAEGDHLQLYGRWSVFGNVGFMGIPIITSIYLEKECCTYLFLRSLTADALDPGCEAHISCRKRKWEI